MLFVRADIHSILSVDNHSIEGFYVEVNSPKTKRLLCCSYNPFRWKMDFHLKILNWSLALYSSHYENFINIEEFNVEANDSAISVFSDTFDLKALLKSQPAIRTQINLLVLTLFGLKPAKFPRLLCNRSRFVWFSQGDSHYYKAIIWET